MTQLFFDDEKLFIRENLRRVYGKPSLEAVYFDGQCSTDWSSGYVFRLDDGSYRLLYYAAEIESGRHAFLMAKSDDGIRFEPEDLRDKVPLEGRVLPHELMLPVPGEEVATVFEDPYAEPDARYKMLICRLDYTALQNENRLFTSPDLYHWTWQKEVCWGTGNEPLAGVFYNQHKQCYTILLRPFWGIRKVGYVETTDWKHFTPFAPCVQQDALDEPLTEVYGMQAIAYAGMYIGFPHLYCELENAPNAKFYGGDIKMQLACSYDGRYWMRSLRESFLDGQTAADTLGYENHMLWFGSAQEQQDGSLLLYAAATKLPHGPAFREHGNGRIHVYRLRKEGFIALQTEDPTKDSVVATREAVWHGGELRVNLQAKQATLAVWESSESDMAGNNVLGIAHPVEGYGHEDCIPFSGDSTEWIPQFRDGRTLDALRGRTLVLEVRLTDGTLYALSGDYTLVYNTQGARYRAFGVLPNA